MLIKNTLLLSALFYSGFTHANTNPLDFDNFYNGEERCGLLQLEGITSNGNACFLNIGFGRAGHPSNEGSAPCIPTSTPKGNLIIKDASGNSLDYENIGSSIPTAVQKDSFERYNPETDLVERVKSSFSYDAESKLLEVKVKGDTYEALDVVQIGPRYFYKKGDLVSVDSVNKSLDCKISG